MIPEQRQDFRGLHYLPANQALRRFLTATAVALLLNVVSLLFATINYWRGKLIDWRVGVPILITAVLRAPSGARVAPLVNSSSCSASLTPFSSLPAP